MASKNDSGASDTPTEATPDDVATGATEDTTDNWKTVSPSQADGVMKKYYAGNLPDGYSVQFVQQGGETAPLVRKKASS